MTKAKVLLVDDHPIVREGLAARINHQRDLSVCGEAQSPAEALRMIVTCNPDIAVVDLALPGGDGLSLIRDLMNRRPRLRVLVFSVQDERLYAPRALLAGAKGYLMKQAATDRLVEAIRRILAGEVYLSDQMRSRLLNGLVKDVTSSAKSPLERFSDRELEVFRLMGNGSHTHEIATHLHLSIKTVETYYERIKLHLNVEDFRDLLRQAMLWVRE